MKRTLLVLVAVIMVLSICACSQNAPAADTDGSTNTQPTQDGTSQGSTDADVTIGLCYSALDLFAKKHADAHIALIEEAGWKYILTNADQDPSQQLADCESILQADPDIVMIRAAADDGLIGMLDACNAADVPVIFTAARPGMADGNYEEYAERYVTYLVDPLPAAPVMLAEHLNEWLEEDESRHAYAAYIYGDYSSTTALCRVDDIKNNVDPDRITHLVDNEGNWNAQDSMALVEDWLIKYPEMNVIVPSSDEMAIGVIQALQAAGKSPDDYWVCGYDAIDEMHDYIREGWCDISAGLDLQKEAAVAMDVFQKVLDGKEDEIEAVTYYYSLYPMTTENIDDILDGKIETPYYTYEAGLENR